MIIRPSSRKRRDVIRPAVLIDAGRARSLDDGTVHDLAKLPKGLRVYVSWDDADALAQAGQGEMIAWGDEPIRWRHERHGDAYRRLSDAVIVRVQVDTPRAFDVGIAAWAEWLHSYNTNPGWSLGGSSMNLLRATLEADLPTTLGTLPPPRWTLGGRQECFVERGTAIHGAVQLDLPAAYTHVIGNLRYGGAWRLATDGWRQWHQAGFPVLIRAHVRLPQGLTVGPLHRRPQRKPDAKVMEIFGFAMNNIFPSSGRLTGLWTAAEIEQAENIGARITITHAYVHAGGDTVFADWHDAIMEGRTLPGFGGQLCKATGNALWGQFVIDDRKRLQVQRWNGSYQALPVQSSSGHQKRAWDLGELVCGTVRAKLYEMLSLNSDRLICCHTDGLWVRDIDDRRAVEVKDMFDWRLKTDAAELHILDQQKYRYRTRRARTYTTVFSGVPAARADDVFQRLWAAHA